MCAIVDVNSSGEIVASTPLPGARAFKEWMAMGNCCLAIGGRKYKRELGRGFSDPDRAKTTTISEWVRAIDQAGRRRTFDDDEIDALADKLRAQRRCQSDDEHIVALAMVSGARLLYSKDKRLHGDFTDPGILNNPNGKVCPRNLTFGKTKEWLDQNEHLCI